MPPTILKRRHDLRNKNVTLKLMKKFKDLKVSQRMEYARFKSNERIEEMSVEDLRRHLKNLLDDDADLLLDLAGAPVCEDSLRKLAHVAILLANEIGQPQGHDLQDKEDTEEEDDEQGPSTSKRKRTTLKQRIENLEKVKEDTVKDLKEKVRSLALQSKPNEALLLLTLDELSKQARKHNDPESDVYDELCRQANRHQGEVNIATLTLSVLGGKASDIVLKAMAKCLKEKQVEDKLSTTSSAKTAESASPLESLYPPLQMPYFMPQTMTGWPNLGMYHYQFNRRFSGNRQNRWRPRGQCYFCNSTEHAIKDCEKMKIAKNK